MRGLADDAADAGARGDNLRERRRTGSCRAPVQPVAEQQLLARLRLAAGFQKATMLSKVSSGVGISTSCTAPLPQVRIFRFDPQTRAALVEHAIILVVVEVAVALQQAEAARVLVEVRVEAQIRAG